MSRNRKKVKFMVMVTEFIKRIAELLVLFNTIV